jgi:hypothetical protein
LRGGKMGEKMNNLYKQEITKEEKECGFRLVEIENPDGQCMGHPLPAISAVVREISDSERIVKMKPFNKIDEIAKTKTLKIYENALKNKTVESIKLFEKIWQTTCGGFKNESQNYSQIALASLINFNALIEQTGDTVFLVKGDVLLKNYNRKKIIFFSL